MMNPEKRICQSCKKEFVIEPEDFQFYDKIKVPPPTWCPDCRYRRRLSWRNTWHLFKKKDARTGKEIFSIFPEESPVKIYDREFWTSDGWDPLDYGRDYGWDKPFFEQFRDLMLDIPLPAHSVTNLVNCQYCTNANDIKGCYLVRAASFTEDSLYLIWDSGSKRCLESHMTVRCELSYGNVNTTRCYKTFFSVDCEDCQDVVLSKDCIACNSCFGCIGLRNKSYCIFNDQYTKEQYIETMTKLDIGSAKNLADTTVRAREVWMKFPHKFMHGRQNTEVSGDYISNSKNAKQCYRVRGGENIKFCQNLLSEYSKDSYDHTNYAENTELVYDSLIIGSGGYNIRFSTHSYPNNKNLEYCFFALNSSDCFGCIGMNNKQYCILNKQYSKEEYEELTKKIREHMSSMPYVDVLGRKYGYGEFFPSELSPFPYEATEAQEFFPLTEEEAKQKGFAAYPTKKQSYSITLKSGDIPDHIKDVKDSILEEVIECAHQSKCVEECTGAFRVVRDELEFCRKMNIALPRLCPNCRHYSRLVLRNMPKFVRRQCQCAGVQSEDGVYKNSISHRHDQSHCSETFETSYAPDRPEIVYCESCYQSEVA